MPDTPIRFLHLSDFHVGKDNYAQRKIFARILDHIENVSAADGLPDLVFITGDVANRGELSEYVLFNEEFLQPLFERLGAGGMDRVFIVPGNHDVDRTRNPYFDRESICDPDSRFFDGNADGLRLRGELIPRFNDYVAKDTSAVTDWIGGEAGAFTSLVEVRGKRLRIVGLNTAWLSKDDKDRHNLSPGPELLDDVLRKSTNADALIVLGHHPIDWFRDEQVEPIRALFGDHRAIYLHGHLHRHRGRPEDGSGRPFLTFQSGAAFQTRNDEVWRNGMLWGEIDFERVLCRVQPRHWEPQNQEWPITSGSFPDFRRDGTTDWWAFPLPSQLVRPSDDGDGVGKIRPLPNGWRMLDQEFLVGREAELEDSEALHFFDGAEPQWGTALSATTPRREIVGQLMAAIESPSEGRPKVILLSGPSGEGKSTALLQAVAAATAAHPDWLVCWRDDHDAALPLEWLASLPVGVSVLVATEDADVLAKSLFEVCRDLSTEARTGVTFLMASRDSDWVAAGGSGLDWHQHVQYVQLQLSGLSAPDATLIVEAWARYGEQGLGGLSGLDVGVAAQRLRDAAREEGMASEGALIGAMLKVRLSDARLLEHISGLMRRLGERSLANGGDLQQALGYICAMHALDLPVLTRTVLAEALGCPMRSLKATVLAPLAREAVTTTTSQWVLSRHRLIAQAVLRVLEASPGVDLDYLYVDLAAAAYRVFSREFVPEFGAWRYGVPDSLAGQGRYDLAIRVAQQNFAAEPRNSFLLVYLSRLLRDAGDPNRALRLFNVDFVSTDHARVVCYEWAVAAGESGDYELNALLAGFCATDRAVPGYLGIQDVERALSGFGVACREILRDQASPELLRAISGVVRIGAALSDRFTNDGRQYFEQLHRDADALGAPESELADSIDAMGFAMRAVWDRCEWRLEPHVRALLDPSKVSFDLLEHLIATK